MIDEAKRNKLLALARKTLDESSPEPERVTSGRMLAREIEKLLADESPLVAIEMSPEAKRATDRVAQVVRAAEAKTAPRSPVTWVEFDLPEKPAPDASPFGGAGFGRKARRDRSR